MYFYPYNQEGKGETFTGGPIIIFLLILFKKIIQVFKVVAVSAELKILPWLCHSAYLCLGPQWIF